MKAPSTAAHWRDSARPPKFFIIDARAAFPLIPFFMHMTWWTFSIAVIATFFFSILYHYGFTLAIFGRWLRAFIAGKRKVAVPWWV